MGQQQLLLIVLGVIIVGIAVVVGINVFSASAASSNREAITADLTNLASMAQQYYRKPLALGGGGNLFTGWVIPTSFNKTANMSAIVTSVVAAGTVTFTAVGNETGTNGSSPVSVSMAVSPTAITSTTVLN